MSKCTCEGQCVCAELEAFLGEAQALNVTTAVLMQNEMFDLCTGTALKTGESVLNIVIRNPNTGDEGVLSFRKNEALRLISMLIRGYDINWPDELQ